MELDLERALTALDSVTLGRRLKEARQAAGLTQPQAAGPDASAAYLSRIEKGERRPGPRLVEQLCSRLGVAPELIILGTPAPDMRAAECAVDFAELALMSGTVPDALGRATELLASQELAKWNHLVDRALLVKASAQAASGNTAEAVTTFEALIDRSPTRSVMTQANLRLSRLLRESGDLARSIAVAESALAGLESVSPVEDGSGPDARLDDVINVSVTLAAAHWERGDVATALSICRRAVVRSETAGSVDARAAAYWNTAIIESESGNLDEALTLTRKALAILSGAADLRLHARLRTQLAELLLRTDPPQTGEAIELLSTAQATLSFSAADAPETMHTRLTLARAHFAAGDSTQAEAEAAVCLREGADLPFVSASAASLLGEIALERQDPVAAREAYLQAIHALSAAGADRRAAQLWFDLGSALDRVGLSEEAKDAYRRAAASTGLSTPPVSVRHV